MSDDKDKRKKLGLEEFETIKQEMKKDLDAINKEKLFEEYMKSTYEKQNLDYIVDKLTKEKDDVKQYKIKIEELKLENRNLRKENYVLRTQIAEKSQVANHYQSKEKVNFVTRTLQKAKEASVSILKNVMEKGKEFANTSIQKGKDISNSAVEKGKDKTEDFMLERKKDYHKRFQKSRAFLKSVNDLVLKPATDLTKKQINNSRKKLELINNKVNVELNKQSLDKRNTLNYAVMYAAVVTEKSSQKIYEVSGAKKVVEATMNSEAANKVKNAYEKAVTSYSENIEANKAKAKVAEQNIEAKKETKKVLAN